MAKHRNLREELKQRQLKIFKDELRKKGIELNIQGGDSSWSPIVEFWVDGKLIFYEENFTVKMTDKKVIGVPREMGNSDDIYTVELHARSGPTYGVKENTTTHKLLLDGK